MDYFVGLIHLRNYTPAKDLISYNFKINTLSYQIFTLALICVGVFGSISYLMGRACCKRASDNGIKFQILRFEFFGIFEMYSRFGRFHPI